MAKFYNHPIEGILQIEEPKSTNKDNWYFKHPDFGWVRCATCEAADFATMFTDGKIDWPIKLGEGESNE